MKRLVFATVVVVLALSAGRVTAGLSKGDKAKLGRFVAECLDPFADDAKRTEAWRKFTESFAGRASKDLAEVVDLTEVLVNGPERPSQAAGVRSKELALADLGLRSPEKWKYLVSVPKKYSGSGEAWPLIVCIPDKGQTPEAYLDLYWKDPEIRESHVIAVLEMNYADILKEVEKDVQEGDKTVRKKVKERVPFNWDEPEGHVRFWRLVYNLQFREFKIDPNRIILDGAGLGREGLLALGTGSTWRFAGLVIRGGTFDSPLAANLSHLNVLYVPGEEGKADEGLQKAVGASFTAAGADAAWAADGAEGSGASLRAWIHSCVRQRYPLPSKWVAVTQTENFSYWVFITRRFEGDKPAEISLSTDLKKNVVSVETQNVAEFTLFLNDLLVNLDQEFTLMVNGAELYKYTRARSADQMLQHAFAHSDGRLPRDPGCVFTAEIDGIRVPPPPAAPAAGGGDDKKGD